MDLYFRLLLLPVIFEFVMGAGYDCNDTDIHINATMDPQVIRSPDFPLGYAKSLFAAREEYRERDGQVIVNNVSCKVLVKAPTDGHVLHVQIVHMQLNNWNSSCGDRVIAYDGNSSDASELHTWCRADKMATSTSGDSLFLVFETDDFLTDSGFVLRFWEDGYGIIPDKAQPQKVNKKCGVRMSSVNVLIEGPSKNLALYVNKLTSVSTTCRPGNSSHLSITDTPVLLTIPGIPLLDEQRCVYHLKTADDRRISLTLKNWGDTSPGVCENTRLQMYEDKSPDSQLIISWRHPNPPFSRIITTGSSLTINFTATTPTTTNTATSTTTPAPLCTFALVATSISNNSGNDAADIQEVTTSPSYIWYSGQIQGQIKLVSRDVTKTVRLDVIGASCNPNCFSVIQDNPDGILLNGTFTDNTTTYRSTGPVIFISNFTGQSENKLLLRVTSLDGACNGGVKRVKATTDAAVTSMLDMAACKYNGYYIYNITTDHADHIVSLKLTRNLFNATSPDKECNRSYINIYDGNPHSRLLRKWCWKQTPYIAVTGDKSYLTFVVATSHGDFPGPLTVTHFALLSASRCKPGLVDLKASADVTKYLSSPNFPGPYSVNNDCTWRISAPRINYVVLVNVVESDLPDDCSDLVYVIYGLYPTDKTSGRLCGQDRGHFRSVGPFLILRFTSNSFDNRSGFKIAYSTEHNTGGQRTEGGPPVGSIAGACIAIFVVAGVIYVCVHEQRKRHKQAKQEIEGGTF